MPTQPLFVFGLTRRTGTHYLAALLNQHPRCAPLVEPVSQRSSRPEDYLFDRADVLLSYVAAVHAKWPPEWGLGDADPALVAELAAALGRFVVRVGSAARAGTPEPSYVVTKTPSTVHLPMLVQSMPKLPVLVIARDGRDVAESGHASFGLSYERWMRVWSYGVENLRRAAAHDTGQSVLVVRYEDLVRDLKPTLQTVLAHLGLAESEYPWGEAEELPVLGSSVIRGESGDFSWTPTADTAGVIGKARWDSWPESRKRRFLHLAAEHMRYLGYEIGGDDVPASARDRLLDRAWDVASKGRRTRDRLRDALRVLRGRRAAVPPPVKP